MKNTVYPGSSKAAELNAVITAASTQYVASGLIQEVVLVQGTYQLESAIILKDGVKLIGAGIGQTILKNTWSPSSSLADDRTNCMMSAVGVLDSATLNTTLTTNITPSGVAWYGAGTRKVSVVSTGTAQVGQYICIGGHETAVGEIPGGSNGSSIDSAEMLLVDAIEASPPRFTFRAPTMQHHVTTNGGVGTALFVQKVIPVQNIFVEGISFDAGGSTIAVGIRMDRVLRANIINCSFKGFSRAGIEVALGSKEIDLIDIKNEGECQCGIFLSASMDISISGYRTARDGLRAHAYGLRRASFFVEQNCINVRFDGFDIRHTVQGISLRGGRHINVTNGIIDDCDIRSQNIADSYHITLRGVGLCTGGGEGAWDEYLGPVKISNVSVSNCRFDPANPALENGEIPMTASVCLHDFAQGEVTSLSVVNNGLSNYTTIDGDDDYAMYGVVAQDCSFRGNDWTIKGCEYGFTHRSTYSSSLRNFDIVASPGSGNNASIAMMFATMLVSGIQISDGRIGGIITFSSNYLADSNMCMYNCDCNDFLYERLIPVQNKTGRTVYTGMAATLDTSGTAGQYKIVAPSAAGQYAGVIVLGQGFGCQADRYCFWAPPNAADSQVHVKGDAIVAGDLLEAAGPFAQTFTAAGDTVTSNGINLPEWTIVRVSTTGTLPTPLAINTDYWARNCTANTFKLSATYGGNAITLSGGSGTHTVTVQTPMFKVNNSATKPVGRAITAVAQSNAFLRSARITRV